MIAFRNRLDAWRARSEAERLAYFLDRNSLGPSPDGRVRAGILCPCLNMGGAETWQLTLARSVDRHLIDWVGCVVIPDRDHSGPGFPHHPAILARMNELMPVSVGPLAARDLVERCDVLIAWAIHGIPGLMYGMTCKPRVISVCHAPQESPWGREVYGPDSGVDHWIAVSELAYEAIPEPARAATPVSVIWNAVDPDRLRVDRPRSEVRRSWGVPIDSHVVGFLGRVSLEKDPHALRRAIDHLPTHWHAVIVGAGAEVIDPHLRLRRVGPDHRAGDVLNAFDVLCVPSYYESFGLTICEGWWMGVPVVSTPVGIARMVPGLIHPIAVGADGPTLAQAIIEADRLGPVEGALDFARDRLGPDRFGHEWTDLIRSMSRWT